MKARLDRLGRAIAHLLPPEVAYWAFLRVSAEIAKDSPSRRPEDFTVGEIAAGWLRGHR